MISSVFRITLSFMESDMHISWHLILPMYDTFSILLPKLSKEGWAWNGWYSEYLWCMYILLENFCYLKQSFVNSVSLHTVQYTFHDIMDINQYKLNLKQISQFQGLLAYFSQYNPWGNSIIVCQYSLIYVIIINNHSCWRLLESTIFYPYIGFLC